MKKKIIISLLLVTAIILISVTCGLHVTAYNNTSKTNTVFVIDENGYFLDTNIFSIDENGEYYFLELLIIVFEMNAKE